MPNHQYTAVEVVEIDNTIPKTLSVPAETVPSRQNRTPSRLNELETIIARGIQTFIEVGAALAEINEQRLYREQGYATFDEYCRSRWEMDRTTAYRRISAAEVVQNVAMSQQKTPSLSQAIELATLTPDQQRAIAGKLDFDDATVAEVREAVREVRATSCSVHLSSKSVEWYTPPKIIERVLKMFGEIDLDPCSEPGSAPTVPARTRFTKADDGLAQAWAGRVFMNPPYGAPIDDWIEKLISAYGGGAVTEAIALLSSRTDTRWFRRLVRAGLVCFVSGRLRFSESENSAPFPSLILYLGNRLDAFRDAFDDLGPILIEMDDQIAGVCRFRSRSFAGEGIKSRESAAAAGGN